MLNDLAKQLQSRDAEERKQAIVALGRLRNRAALKALEAVYRRDPDPDLRQFALKVGRYIEHESQETSPIRGTVTEPEFLPGVKPWDLADPTFSSILDEEPAMWQARGLRRFANRAVIFLVIAALLVILFLFVAQVLHLLT